MRTLTMDFETYASDTYNIDALTAEGYIRGSQFEAQALCVATVGEPDILTLLGSDAIETWVREQDWNNITAMFHNAQFDAFIL